MRVQSVVLLVAIVCLLPLSAAADISRISPQTISFGDVEGFLTIFGSGFAGTEPTYVTFDGPAGTFTLLPSNSLPNNDENAPPLFPDDILQVFIPVVVATVPGEYQVTVTVKNIGEDAVTLGPAILTVQEQVLTGPPLIAYNETVVQEAEDIRGAVVFYDVSAQNPNGDPVDVTCSPESGTRFPIGTSTVLCSASNDFGTSTASITVVVIDLTPPVVTVPEDFSSASNVVTFEASAVDNIDGPLPVTCTPPSGSTFGPGITQVICEATDANLNIGFGIFLVTLAGGLPELTVPADVTLTSPDGDPVVYPYEATATNNALVECLPSSMTFVVGTTTVDCTATNLTGSVTKSFNVTVISGVAPEITVPDDIVVEATSPDGAEVTFEVTATNDATIVCTPPSGSIFALGTTTVNCTATNAGGDDSGSFNVTVVDTTPPQILSVEATPNTLWPPNHKMVDIAVTVIAIDAADPNPVSRIISVSSNQPVNGTGDGDVAPDWQITGALTVKLRSERSQGIDRIYTITVETVDDSGNSSTATTTVVVSQGRRRAAR